MRRALAFATLAAATLAAVLASLLTGAAPLTPADVWHGLAGNPDQAHQAATRIVRAVRAPRTAAGLLIGGALATSGATLQALLRNPLAEPYLLGLSGGAAFGAVLAIVTGAANLAPWSLPLVALGGALLAIATVLRAAAHPAAGFEPRTLILAGVVVGAFFGALVMLLLALAPGDALRSAVFWTMGHLDTASWTATGLLALYVLPATAFLWARARTLDLLMLGEDTASYLGTDVRRERVAAYLAASMLAAAAVAVAGVIGFVGLVVPHAVRLLWGAGHRFLLPAGFLLGAAFLVFADVVARAALAPAELPVGVVTALIGVPAFVWLLRREVSR